MPENTDYDLFGEIGEIPKLREFDDIEEEEEEEDFNKIELDEEDKIEDIEVEKEAPKKKDGGGFSSFVNSDKLRRELGKESDELDNKGGGSTTDSDNPDTDGEPGASNDYEEDDLVTMLLKYPKEVWKFIENWRKMGHNQVYKLIIEKPHRIPYLKGYRDKLMDKVVEGTATQEEKVQMKELSGFIEGMSTLQKEYLAGVEYSPLHKEIGEMWVNGKLKKMQASGKKYNTDLAFALFMASAEVKNGLKLEEIASLIPKVVINAK